MYYSRGFKLLWEQFLNQVTFIKYEQTKTYNTKQI